MEQADSEKYMQQIINALRAGRAVAMVGSGFSLNADLTGRPDARMLLWDGLASRFYEKIYGHLPGKDDHYIEVLKLAQQVEAVFGRQVLDGMLREGLPDEDFSPGEAHELFVSLPWKDIFTTNYDTLLERAIEVCVSEGKCRPYDLVLTQADLPVGHGRHRLIKLHGSFPSVRPYIITEEDYREYPRKYAAFINTVQQAMLENVFVMIGYSCDDPNFLQWIGWVRDNLGASLQHKMYMLCVNPPSDTDMRLLSQRNIIPVDMRGLYWSWQEQAVLRTDNVSGQVTKVLPSVPSGRSTSNASAGTLAVTSLKWPDAQVSLEHADGERTAESAVGNEAAEAITLPQLLLAELGKPSAREIVEYCINHIEVDLRNERGNWQQTSRKSLLDDGTAAWLEQNPGWAYMPYDVRKRLEPDFLHDFGMKMLRVLKHELEAVDGLISDTAKSAEMIRRLYLLVRYYDVMDMPLGVYASQSLVYGENDDCNGFDLAEQVYLYLAKVDWQTAWSDADSSQKAVAEAYRQGQTVYVQLLRAFRERGNMARFCSCLKSIRFEILPEAEKQFVQAECCRCHVALIVSSTCRSAEGILVLQASLAEQLRAWHTQAEDCYWPMIKASILMEAGCNDVARQLLYGCLKVVWRHINKEGINARYASLERSALRLLHVVDGLPNAAIDGLKRSRPTPWTGQPVFDYTLEEQTYRLAMRENEPLQVSEGYNFNLTQFLTWHMGRSTYPEYAAAAYWRFQERTGAMPRHCSCVLMQKDDFELSLHLLRDMYPRWCLQRLLLMGEPKSLDALLGRNELQEMQSDEVDAFMHQLLQMVKCLLPCLKKDAVYQDDYAGQAAKVLSALIGRMCYKASAESLRSGWEILCQIKAQGLLSSFQGAADMCSGLLSCMTVAEQNKIYGSILDFPMSIGPLFREYQDPLTLLKVSESKYHLSKGQYGKLVGEVRSILEGYADSDRDEMTRKAMARFSALAQLTELEEQDEHFFFEALENFFGRNSDYLRLAACLSHDKADKRRYAGKIYSQARKSIQNMMKGTLSTSDQTKVWCLISVWQHLDLTEVKLADLFSDMRTVLQKVKNTDIFPLGSEQVGKSCNYMITLAELVLLKLLLGKEAYADEETKSQIKEFILQVHHSVGERYALLMLWQAICSLGGCPDSGLCLSQVSRDKLMEDSSNLEDFGLFIMLAAKGEAAWLKELSVPLQNGLSISLDILGRDRSGTNVSALRFWSSVLYSNFSLSAKMHSRLERSLLRLADDTLVKHEDSETIARKKIIMRHYACLTAAAIDIRSQGSKQSKAIQRWREIKENKEEMAEVRLVRFYGE